MSKMLEKILSDENIRLAQKWTNVNKVDKKKVKN